MTFLLARHKTRRRGRRKIAMLFDPVKRQLFVARLHERVGHAEAAEAVYRRIIARQPDCLDAQIALGRQMLRQRRYDEAIVIWQKATILAPRAAGPAFQLARAFHRKGYFGSAIRQYMRVVAIDPLHQKAATAIQRLRTRVPMASFSDSALETPENTEEARLIASSIVVRARPSIKKNPEAALIQFEDALNLAEDLPEALSGAAECLERLSRPKKALELWERFAHYHPHAIEPSLQRERLILALQDFADGNKRADQPEKSQQGVDRKTIDTLLRQARRAFNAGRLEDAEAALEEALAIDDKATAVLSLLSRLHLRQEKRADAIAVLTRLAAINPELSEPHETLARLYVEDKQWAAAARSYENAIAHQENPAPELLDAAARVYREMHDWPAACRVLKQLVNDAPLRTTSRLAYSSALQKAGDIAEAERQLEAIIADDPRQSDAFAMLARIKSKTDPESAFECWSRVAELRRHAPEPPLQMARIRARQKRFADALPLYRSVLEREPDHDEAMVGIGQILAETDVPAAIRHYGQWAVRRPKDAGPQIALARLYQKDHQWERAETLYRQILDGDPDNLTVRSRYAELLSRDPARFDEALDLWRQIGERDPNSTAPAVQRANLFERTRRFDMAEAEYRSALDQAPDDATAVLGLARLLANQARWNEALPFFEAAYRLRPDRTDGALGWGRCLERLNRPEDALAAYEKVLALQPADANALTYRGRLLRQLGRVEEAIEAWRDVCVRAPQNADAWYELVFMLASAERETEAITALDTAEAALPRSAESWMRLGLAAQAAQLPERAVTYFERAIAAEPNAAEPQAQLGFYYFRQGIVDGAFHHLLASRELKPANIPVAKRLVDTIHILNDVGIDHVAASKAPSTTGAVLVPERLFGLVRQTAERQVAPYDPVPRRVIVVSASLAPGGAERQVVNMVRGHSRAPFNLDQTLFCLSLVNIGRRDFFLPQLTETGIEVVTPAEGAVEAYLRAPEVGPHARLIRQFPEDMVGPIAFWLAEFSRRRPEIVHAWQDFTNLTAAVAALLAGVPRIILCTRSVRPDNPRRRLKRYMREGYRALLGHPSVILTNNSRAGADDYAAWLDVARESIEVVHNGIDFERFERTVDPAETIRARQSLGIPEDAPVLGGAFRMSEEKRPLLWIDVAAAVARQNPRTHFIVCGDGPMRSDMIQAAARLGIADKLHLPGSQPNIASWYKAMDVVMLTSRHEGLPNVLLEAQCLGIPIVAPDVGGMSETVLQGITGWTVRDADAAALAERALFCLENRDWSKTAAAKAPPFVKEHFGMMAMLQRTMALYRVPEFTAN